MVLPFRPSAVPLPLEVICHRSQDQDGFIFGALYSAALSTFPVLTFSVINHYRKVLLFFSYINALYKWSFIVLLFISNYEV